MDELQSLKAQLSQLVQRVSELETKVATLEKQLNNKELENLTKTPNLIE